MIRISTIVMLLGAIIAVGLLPIPIPGLGLGLGLLIVAIGAVLRLLGL